jgi:hypothetical protein
LWLCPASTKTHKLPARAHDNSEGNDWQNFLDPKRDLMVFGVGRMQSKWTV